MALISSGSVGGAAAAPTGPTNQEGSNTMGLKRYEVEVNGAATTLQLSDEDAKLHGLTEKNVAGKQKRAPANKSAAAEGTPEAGSVNQDRRAAAAADAMGSAK